jgi:hypothetical protein
MTSKWSRRGGDWTNRAAHLQSLAESCVDPTAVPHSGDPAPNSFSAGPSPAYARTERRMTAPAAHQARRGALPGTLQPRLLFQAAPEVPGGHRALGAPGARQRFDRCAKAQVRGESALLGTHC